MGVQSEDQPPETSSGNKRSIDDCPTCGAPVSPFVTKCPYCGADVSRRSWWRARKLRFRGRMRRFREHKSRASRTSRRAVAQAGLTSQTPYAVGFLIVANIFAYISFDVRGDLFNDPGAFSAGAVRAGEWGRLITYQFLHTGILELLFSLILLAIFAVLVEQRFGHVAALGCYLISGIGGGLLAVAVGSGGVAAGSLASTLGLMGAWVVTLTRSQPLERQYPLSAGLLLVAVVLLFGLIQEGMDAWALIGGLVTGALFVTGYLLLGSRR